MMRLAVLAGLFLVIAVAIPLALMFSSPESSQFRGIGVIFIGPFPIILDTSNPANIAILFIPFLVFVLLTTIFLLKTRRIPTQLE